LSSPRSILAPPKPVVHYQSHTPSHTPTPSSFVPDDDIPSPVTHIEHNSHKSSADGVIPSPDSRLLQSPRRPPVVALREIVPIESVNSVSQSLLNVPALSAVSDVVNICVAEIEVNLLLPPDDDLRTVKLPANGTIRDALIAAENIDNKLIVSDHFVHTAEDETELSNDTLLSNLPEPRDLWICRRLNISHFPVLCQSPIPEFHSSEESEIIPLENPSSVASLSLSLSESEPLPEVNTFEDSPATASLPLTESEFQWEPDLLDDFIAPASSPRNAAVSGYDRIFHVRHPAVFSLPLGLLPRPLNYGDLLGELQSATLFDIHVCRQYLNYYHYDFRAALNALRSI
jgi:hypothetical protein